MDGLMRSLKWVVSVLAAFFVFKAINVSLLSVDYIGFLGNLYHFNISQGMYGAALLLIVSSGIVIIFSRRAAFAMWAVAVVIVVEQGAEGNQSCLLQTGEACLREFQRRHDVPAGVDKAIFDGEHSTQQASKHGFSYTIQSSSRTRGSPAVEVAPSQNWTSVQNPSASSPLRPSR